jgi:protocatechuate 3,4-dioxygenase beta subunit
MIADEARLRAAMPRVTETLHGLVRELDLGNDELASVLDFLADVARADELVLLTDVLGVSRVADDLTHARDDGTPSNILGPFYIPGAPEIGNPGSIVRSGTASHPLTLRGRVTDARSGAAVGGAILDVWQADEAGAYSNQVPDADPWNLRGWQRADPDGRYRIETVRPLHYTVKADGPVGRLLETLGRHPWRPAHIHLMVDAPGYRALVTQVYVAGGPYLDDDAVDAVKADLVGTERDGVIEFDVSLAPADDGSGAER